MERRAPDVSVHSHLHHRLHPTAPQTPIPQHFAVSVTHVVEQPSHAHSAWATVTVGTAAGQSQGTVVVLTNGFMHRIIGHTILLAQTAGTRAAGVVTVDVGHAVASPTGSTAGGDVMEMVVVHDVERDVDMEWDLWRLAREGESRARRRLLDDESFHALQGSMLRLT